MTDRITPRQFHAATGVEDWRVVGEGACAYFRSDSFASSAALVDAISRIPGGPGGRHADVDVRAGGVTVRLIVAGDGYYGLAGWHVEVAQRVSAAARELGLPADPAGLQNVQISIDALVTDETLPFWRTVLGYQDRGDGPGDLIDPRGRAPLVYFQPMDAPRPQRNRLHLDVWVPHDSAQDRVAAALAAGGALVTDQFAPSWWVLADVEGNEACVCTWQDHP
ncbi:VOC family protein [Solwaraspora sp. WMMB335]|uniref:VOC family protein n=1 Tax=Solwaraspora sp. WMMB335 TaxID=3404118 RepID=UPI003B93E5B1